MADARIDFQVNYDTSKATSNVSKFGSSLKKVATLATAAFAAKAVVNFANESIELYNAQVIAETKLTEIMTKRIGATDEEIASVKALAAEEQKRGIYGDELIIQGQQQLATFATTTETIKLLTPAMNNLVAQQKGINAGSGDFVNISNLMGKALQGQTGALTRVGISFTDVQGEILKTGTEMERAAVLADVITDNVGDMNVAMAQTDAGKIANATNAFNDLKEKVGEALIPLKTKFYTFLGETLVPFIEDDLIPAISSLWAEFKKTGWVSNLSKLSAALGGIEGILENAVEYWEKLDGRKASGNNYSAWDLLKDMEADSKGRFWNWLSGKANGGTISSNTPYMVGERGPELFTPSSSGSITPNHKLGGGGVTSVNVYPQLSIGGEDIKVMVTGLVSDVLSQTRGVA